MNRFADAAVRLAGAAGLVLGWLPDEFWRATPAELAMMLGAGLKVPAVAGDELGKLMEQFPDG